MLLTIHNLPSHSRYVDVKSMLQEKCGLDELILDNLVPEGKTKKVTVGLADEGDAAILMRKINGLYVNGLRLYVEDKRKKKLDQPHGSSARFSQMAPYNQPVASGAALATGATSSATMNYNEAGNAEWNRPMPMPSEYAMNQARYQQPVVSGAALAPGATSAAIMNYNEAANAAVNRPMPRMPANQELNQPRGSSARFSQMAPYSKPVAPGAALAPSASSSAMMNNNEAGNAEWNQSYMDYGGGFMALPPGASRPPAPARSDRGFTRFQGRGTVIRPSGQHAVKPQRYNFTHRENESLHQMPFKKVKSLKTHPQPAPNTLSNFLEKNPKPKKVCQIMNKDNTSRSQATARLAKQVMLTKVGKLDNSLIGVVFKEVKRCIRSRIDAILSDELHKNYEVVMERYRWKYPWTGDRELFHSTYNIMQEKRENEKEENADAVKSEKNVTQATEKPEGSKDNKETIEKNVDKKPNDSPDAPKEKKLQPQVQFTKKDHYKLDPLRDKMVGEELEKLIDIFFSECENPDDLIERAICNRITTKSVAEFKQVSHLQLAKRILDIRTGLAVRIYSTQALPRRALVKEHLKPYRIKKLVLKRNKKGPMFVATLASYEDYDRLCYKQNDVIAGVPVSIGSIYLLAPPQKLTKKQIKSRREQFLNSQIVPKQSQTEPSISRIETTSNQVNYSMNNWNAKCNDFATDRFGRYCAENSTTADPEEDNFGNIEEVFSDPEEVNFSDPEEVNFADMNDDELEDY